jgi:hypothetical protein
MKKAFGIGAGLFVVALSAFGAVAGLTNGSSASTQTTQTTGGFVAIAVGQLEEDGGEYATVDLHAGNRNGKIGGALRFFSEEYGYYNGAVRTVKVENGVIHVTGAGGLFPPGGGRVQVRFDATFSTQDKHGEIKVTRANGTTYTMSGTLDGLVTVQNAPVRTPAAAS